MSALPDRVLPLRILSGVQKRKRLLRPDTVASDVCARYGVTFDAVAGWGRGGQLNAARRRLRGLRARSQPEHYVFRRESVGVA